MNFLLLFSCSFHHSFFFSEKQLPVVWIKLVILMYNLWCRQTEKIKYEITHWIWVLHSYTERRILPCLIQHYRRECIVFPPNKVAKYGLQWLSTNVQLTHAFIDTCACEYKRVKFRQTFMCLNSDIVIILDIVFTRAVVPYVLDWSFLMRAWLSTACGCMFPGSQLALLTYPWNLFKLRE